MAPLNVTKPSSCHFSPLWAVKSCITKTLCHLTRSHECHLHRFQKWTSVPCSSASLTAGVHYNRQTHTHTHTHTLSFTPEDGHDTKTSGRITAVIIQHTADSHSDLFFLVQSKTKNVFCPHFTVCIFPMMLKNCWIWFHLFAETQQRHRGDETLHQSVAERCEHRVRKPWLDNYCNLSAIFKWRQQQQFQTPFKEWHF